MTEVRAAQNNNLIDGANAEQIAQNMLSWAKSHNLLSKSPVDDAVEDNSTAVPFEGQQMFSVRAVEDVLRKRSINLIGFNEREKKIVVFTNGKINVTERKILPFSVKGYVIDYIQGGVAQVRGDPPAPISIRSHILDSKYVCCGSSVFPANCIGAGTFGLLARGADGTLFGVTNNHVTGACNNAVPGLPILSPGPADVSDDSFDPFTIGRHTRLLPINDGIPENIDISQNCDASIFAISDHARVSSMQGAYFDTPDEIAEPEAGMRVEKVGRTTGRTTGTIVAESASPVPVFYTVPEYNVRKTVFFSKVYIVQAAADSMFSLPGDSGSLVVAFRDDGSRVAIGLVFAGNPQRGLSFILGLPMIMDRLGLQIVYGHNNVAQA
jgi:hypothetical protein